RGRPRRSHDRRPRRRPRARQSRNVSEASVSDATDARGRPRVAVTGLGVKTPAGTDLETFWARLLSGRSTAATISRYDPTPLPVRIGCEVQDFDPAAYLGPKEARRVDRVTQLGLAAAV